MKYFSQTRNLILASLAAILLVACSKKAPDIPDAGTAAPNISGEASSSASSTTHNPCSLLEAKEVEAVLGGTLAGPPYRFNKTGKEGPAPDGEACRYETAGYHFIEIEVEWEGGAQTMKMYGTVQNLVDQKMKGVLKLGDGSELTGEWDEAKVVNCCTFLAMRGDQLVTVDIAGSNSTLEQAAKIADAALKRIEKPLSVESAAGIAAAIARYATRPKERDPCSLVSRAEAETALEAPLTMDPVADGSKCIYTYTGTGKLPWKPELVLDIRWRNGFAQYREHAALTANVGKVFALGDKAGIDKKESAAPDPALIGPWEAAQFAMFEFSAVKKDVLVKADASAAIKKEEPARRFVTIAMSKL